MEQEELNMNMFFKKRAKIWGCQVGDKGIKEIVSLELLWE